MSDVVSALELCEHAESCTATAGFIFDHVEDSERADELCLLMAALRDTRQAIDECYRAVERHVLAMDTPKSFEVLGLGLVERKRGVSRKSWDNDGLWNHVIRYARDNDADVLALLSECARPSWRITPLRAIGVQVDEWCVEDWGAESLSIPSRDLEDRGRSFNTGEVA